MKRIALIAGGIFVILIGVALTLPFLIPKSVYGAQIERAAGEALQRKVTLDGEVRLSLFPRIAASVGGMKVANPDGFDGPYMIEAGELRGAVKWAPLLFGQRVEVHELAFVDASVSLQKKADGTTNWVLEKAPPSGAAPSEGGGFNGAVEHLRLENASLTYQDDETGARYELRELDLTAAMTALDQPFKLDARGFFQSQRFDIEANLDSLDAATTGKPATLEATLGTSFGKARYDGTIALGEVPTLDGTFSASSEAVSSLLAYADVEVPFDLAKLGKINAEGDVSGTLETLAINVKRFSQSSDLAKTGFTGKINLGPAPTIEGDFAFNAPKIDALAKFAAIELPLNLAPLGTLDVEGKVSGAFTQPALMFEKLRVKGPLITANYSGAVTLGEALLVNGKLSFDTPRAGELATQLAVEVPAASALEKVSFTGNISGGAEALQLSAIDFKHDGDLLTAVYTGDLGLAEPGAFKGKLNASSQKLRQLLSAADVELAPGNAIQTFAATSDVSGTFTNIALSALDLKLDNITAKGNAGIDLRGSKPRLTGKLNMGNLDLSPFLAPADQTAQPMKIEPWSNDKLDLAGLSAADADLQITTTQISLGSVKLTDAALTAKLTDGKLAADLSKFKAFGGNWEGRMTVDAASAVPAVTLAMQGDSVAMSNLLGTLAGFDKLAGTGAFKLDATTRGDSLDALVRGLNGEVSTNLAEGALKGLNVTQMVRSAQSLQTALTTGKLNSIDFRSVLSPTAETDFTRFDSVLKIRNGVANVDILKLISPALGIDGSGSIDLGGQRLDLRLATAIDRTGTGQGAVVQLNGIPVPVRLSGSWSQLKVTPDFSGVQAALQAELKGKLIDEVTGRGGDAVGGIIGGIIGQPAKTPATGAPPVDGETDAPAETAPPRDVEKELESAAEKAARDALGGLFGRKRAPTPPAEPEPAPADEEATP
ncbi:MAG: AsmA family protein [Hyphomonas sp.]|uniref:AsmA family protein n=1 Tax=Hyphomonas sp. TaxID=87 RepID=UPI0034A08769